MRREKAAEGVEDMTDGFGSGSGPGVDEDIDFVGVTGRHCPV